MLGEHLVVLRAWVDESGSDHVKDPNTYILAAALVIDTREEDLREMMLGLRLPGQVKLHWRSENFRRRLRIARTIAAEEVEHLVVVRSAHTAEAGERRRRKCLEHLLYELARMRIDHVVFESRGQADDRRDLELLDTMRRKHLLPRPLHVDHRRGREEPLLWVADAVCGAVSEQRCGNPAHYRLLERKIQLHDH